MTRREKLERRAEKRREWAGSAEAKADAAHERVHQIADGIPFGQPILVGHHSEKRARADQARMERGMRTSVDESRKAERHEQAAASIERQLRTSVFSDDEDAVERLEAQIAELEAERDRAKAYNASCREGTPDASLLDDKQRENLLTLARVAPYQLGKNGSLPSYAVSYVTRAISEKRKRVEQITRDRERVARGERGPGRHMESRYAGVCANCGGEIERGSRIVWYRLTREAVHADYVDGILAASCPGADPEPGPSRDGEGAFYSHPKEAS
jgi:hypothetical protein